jgi:hypothetical protein
MSMQRDFDADPPYKAKKARPIARLAFYFVCAVVALIVLIVVDGAVAVLVRVFRVLSGV